ncbi:hypothetical protein BRADI_3g26650v3 [Brachypodium distachyon]|uniref:RNase H type-1 domain-containing protein n=1 Tax=Brachypodium distachyon TaxID=15368 RepID=A0A0Q3JEE5_BRADI|nr:hypothetical protein BRADI_3g26650v3 [Brachypodium distachyon]
MQHQDDNASFANTACSICGMEAEDGFHAVMTCTKARYLRDCIRKKWNLPPEHELQMSGSDWVLVLLNKVNVDTRVLLLFLWWRAWHLKNDIIFGKGDASVESSAHFLFNYVDSLGSLNQRCIRTVSNSKAPVVPAPVVPSCDPAPKCVSRWKPPPMGFVKLNVDASFIPDNLLAAWGAVLRDSNGDVLGSAWNFIDHCPSAETGEVIACLEGLKNACTWTSLPLILECDCASVVEAINCNGPVRSSIYEVIALLKELLLPAPGISCQKVDREANGAADCIARQAVKELSGGVLRDSVPSCAMCQLAQLLNSFWTPWFAFRVPWNNCVGS